MIKIELLHSFQLVANLGGISRAAEKKALSVMALSKQMSNLEDALGQSLFERSGRTLRLTEFGREFKIEADKVLESESSLSSWLEDKAGRVSGNLRVLFQSPILCEETVIPWLAEFLDCYPELELEFDVKESLIDINEDEYDVFWGIGSYLGDHFPNLKRRDLWCAPYGVFAAPSYLEKHGTPSNPDDLSEHYIVGYLYNQPSNILVLQENGELIYKTLKQRVSSVTGLTELAIEGLGIINAGDDVKQIQTALEQNRLVPILEKYWWQNAEIFVYFHNVRQPQPKVKAFIDFFLNKVKQWGNE